MEAPGMCYFHEDVEAQVWREAFVFGEPGRVLLCCECAILARNFGLSLYALNHIKREIPGFEFTGWMVGGIN